MRKTTTATATSVGESPLTSPGKPTPPDITVTVPGRLRHRLADAITVPRPSVFGPDRAPRNPR